MRTQRNRYLKQVRRLFWEQPDEIRAIERLLGECRYPNATLRLVAKDLGVAGVIEEELPFDGGIFQEDGKTTIKLNSLNSMIRQQFTLAHEIGHLIFVNRLDVDMLNLGRHFFLCFMGLTPNCRRFRPRAARSHLTTLVDSRPIVL